MDGIIFDVDGTLWDSTEVVAEAWTEALRAQGLTGVRMTAAKLKTLFGQTLPDIARQIFPSCTQEEQMRLINLCCDAEHAALEKKGSPLYPGLESTLKKLSEKYPLFIVSNCQAGYIEVFLKSTGLSGYFRDHLCPGDTGLAKAENILRIAEKHSLASPVYVGDTAGDHKACREAGVPFVYAAYGFGETQDPDYRIEQFPDLTDLFL